MPYLHARTVARSQSVQRLLYIFSESRSAFSAVPRHHVHIPTEALDKYGNKPYECHLKCTNFSASHSENKHIRIYLSTEVIYARNGKTFASVSVS